MTKAGIGYDAPETPDGKFATHSFTEGGETRQIERIAAGSGQLPAVWDDTASVTATGLVAGFTAVTTGCGRIVLKAAANTTTGDTFKFRLVFYNSETPGTSSIIGVSPIITQSFSAVVDEAANKIAAHSTFANDCGASSVGVYVEQLSANGTLLLSMSAI